MVWQQHVAIVIALEHVDIRSTDSACADREDQLARAWLARISHFGDRRGCVAIDQVRLDCPPPLDIVRLNLHSGSGSPFGVEDGGLHWCAPRISSVRS